jgi:hypothetical protein
VGLERGPLSLVSTTEELLGRNSSGSGLENREYSRGDPLRCLGFDSRHYQIFWEVVGLDRGPLSLVSTTEELLGRNSSGSGLANREFGRGGPLR